MEHKRRAPKRVIAPKKYPTRKVDDLSKSMSTDELWALHEQIAATLIAKITAEKEVLEDRLRVLSQGRASQTWARSEATTLANSAARVGKTD